MKGDKTKIRSKTARGTWLLGAVVTTCALAGASATLVAANNGGPPTGTSRPARAPKAPSAAAAKYIDTTAIVAQGIADNRQFILAPGKGSLYKPGTLCLTTDMPGAPGVALTCSFTSEFATKGAITTQTAPSGLLTVWGMAPTGAEQIRAVGAKLQVDGRFFVGRVPKTTRKVRFSVHGTPGFLPVGRG